MEGYCLKCRQMRPIEGEEMVTMKNGRSAVRGKCPACGTTINKIPKKETR